MAGKRVEVEVVVVVVMAMLFSAWATQSSQPDSFWSCYKHCLKTCHYELFCDVIKCIRKCKNGVSELAGVSGPSTAPLAFDHGSGDGRD
ncbi:hypothetical protein ABFS83_09G068200 [Erythranthe nasuta]